MSLHARAASIGAVVFFLQVLAATALQPDTLARSNGQDEFSLSLVQANAHIRSSPSSPDPDPPRMYVAEGCDGSTAVMQHAVSLLRLHGIYAGDPTQQKELLDCKRNKFCEHAGDEADGIRKLNEYTRSRRQTLVFKSILHRDMKPTLSKELVGLGTMAVYVTRRNLLDQLVCMIRDCFLDTDEKTSQWGVPVDGNGNPTNLCFERRKSKTKDKARIKVVEEVGHNQPKRSYLKASLEFFEEQEKEGVKKLEKAGYKAAKLYYEDLAGFEEGTEEKVDTSVEAWTTLLQAWGVKADYKKLYRYFWGQARSSSWAQEAHRDTIYNSDEVKEELKKLGRGDLFRGDE